MSRYVGESLKSYKNHSENLNINITVYNLRFINFATLKCFTSFGKWVITLFNTTSAIASWLHDYDT